MRMLPFDIYVAGERLPDGLKVFSAIYCTREGIRHEVKATFRL